MRLPPNYGAKIKWFGLGRVWWLTAALAMALGIVIRMAPERRPFVNPRIEALAYVWPGGCERKKYRSLDKINRECLEPKYYIGDGQKWGWYRTSKWPYYYRVQNDSVFITDVAFNEISADKVTVYRVIDDVFWQGKPR